MASRQLAIRDTVRAMSEGWRPYHGEVQGCVYRELDCPAPEKAAWFQRDGRMLCLGCKKQCARPDARGFELTLPVRRGVRMAFADLPAVSVEQLLDAKALLNVPEAAWVLGVDEKTIYRYAQEGRLEAHPDRPVRVTSRSVREELDRVG